MTQYGMIIDISRCTGCYCCFTACKDEYWGNDYPPYTAPQPKHGQFWLNLEKKERGKYPYVKAAYMPIPCMHCQSAPCIEAADEEAVYRRDDGIVVIDPEKALGQKQLKESCPYGAIYWSADTNLAQKCTFCIHRLEKGLLPRCVQACPADAIIFGDRDDPKSEIAQLLKSGKPEALHPEYATSPSVTYIDLHKMNSLFISGAVFFADTDECAEGVDVTLSGGDSKLTTKTNNYGNFDIDGLTAGEYQLDLAATGYAPKTIQLTVDKDTFIPDIDLSPAQ